jgi:hypothetical protein
LILTPSDRSPEAGKFVNVTRATALQNKKNKKPQGDWLLFRVFFLFVVCFVCVAARIISYPFVPRTIQTDPQQDTIHPHFISFIRSQPRSLTKPESFGSFFHCRFFRLTAALGVAVAERGWGP